MKPNFKRTSSEGRMSEAIQKTSGCFENILKDVKFGEGLFLVMFFCALPSALHGLCLKLLKASTVKVTGHFK